MKDFPEVSNDKLAQARREVQATRKILAVLYKVHPTKRVQVLVAAAAIHGIRISWATRARS